MTASFMGQNEACYARFASYLPSGMPSRTGCNLIWSSLECQTEKLLFVSSIPFGRGYWLPAGRILNRYCGILTSKSTVPAENAFTVAGCNMGMHSTLRVNHARLARTPWASACTGTVPTQMECTARPLPSLWQISTAPLPAHEPASDTCRHCQEWEEDFQRPRKHVILDTTLGKSVLGASCLCWKRGPDVACAAY